MSSGYRHVFLSTFNSEAEQAKKDNLELTTSVFTQTSPENKQTKYNTIPVAFSTFYVTFIGSVTINKLQKTR